MKLLRFLWSSLSSSYELRSFTFLFVFLFHILMVWREYPYSIVENIIYSVMTLAFGYCLGLYYSIIFGSGYAFKRVPGQGLMEVDGRGLALLLMLHPFTLACFVLFVHILAAALKEGGLTNWVLSVSALALGPSGAILHSYVSEAVQVGDVRE